MRAATALVSACHVELLMRMRGFTTASAPRGNKQVPCPKGIPMFESWSAFRAANAYLLPLLCPGLSLEESDALIDTWPAIPFQSVRDYVSRAAAG